MTRVWASGRSRSACGSAQPPPQPHGRQRRRYETPGADKTAHRATVRSGSNPTEPRRSPWKIARGAARSSHRTRSGCSRSETNPTRLAGDLRQPRLCAFTGTDALPILGVDEPIYRRLPCFLIATVDKFAALPWTGEIRCVLRSRRTVRQRRLLRPCRRRGRANHSAVALPPPDLIIQDELHLISGPARHHRRAVRNRHRMRAVRPDERSKRSGPRSSPRTATVRRAETPDSRAVRPRPHVDGLPAARPDRRDSFFARTQARPRRAAPRLYVGVAAQGRSLKVVCCAPTWRCWPPARRLTKTGRRAPRAGQSNPADPYMTLLGYFNSLRELGGSRRIVEDEVTHPLTELRAAPRPETNRRAASPTARSPTRCWN